jgi:hypothetical protein
MSKIEKKKRQRHCRDANETNWNRSVTERWQKQRDSRTLWWGGGNWGRIGYEKADKVKGRNREEEDRGQGTGKR